MESTPIELIIQHTQLAREYNEMQIELAAIKKRKALDIIPLMVDHGSKAKAEVMYGATEDGQRELELTYLSRGKLELKRAIKAELEVNKNESWGNY